MPGCHQAPAATTVTNTQACEPTSRNSCEYRGEYHSCYGKDKNNSVLMVLNSQDRRLVGLCRANELSLRVPVRWSLFCCSMWSAGDLLIWGFRPSLIQVSSEETVDIFKDVHVEGLAFKSLLHCYEDAVAMCQPTTLTPLATLHKPTLLGASAVIPSVSLSFKIGQSG